MRVELALGKGPRVGQERRERHQLRGAASASKAAVEVDEHALVHVTPRDAPRRVVPCHVRESRLPPAVPLGKLLLCEADHSGARCREVAKGRVVDGESIPARSLDADTPVVDAIQACDNERVVDAVCSPWADEDSTLATGHLEATLLVLDDLEPVHHQACHSANLDSVGLVAVGKQARELALQVWIRGARCLALVRHREPAAVGEFELVHRVLRLEHR